MCGITGLYLFSINAAAKITSINESNKKLILRGPDSGNTFTDGPVALGHRRLSIIDTSHAAAQPMQDMSKRYTIIFNGEIFNYKALVEKHLSHLAQQLGKKEITSDTETLLYLLIQYGTACLSWLDGFFAFALYDSETKQLLLARDRYGKKPLLYYSSEDYLAFASEMKALLAYDIPKEIDFSVLHQYLQLNYIPQPQSMLKNVHKLRPGHFLQVTSQGTGTSQPFYELKTRPEAYNHFSYTQAKDELVLRMDQAVQERMLADVPLGAFLSGGIDSSVIVALASRYTQQLNTFSIGYRDNAFFDETQYAKSVARMYNTNHTVFSLGNNDFLEHIYDVLDYIDEPFADSSAIPVYILSKHTRRHVTVALSGDGGDEVFAGYNKHAAEWRVRQDSMLNRVVKMGSPLWDVLPKSRNNPITNKFRQFKRFADGARLSPRERYWRWASLASEEQVDNLLHPDCRRQVNKAALHTVKETITKAIQTDDYNEVLVTDMNLVLLSDMLVKVDLMSMANSLEVRSPFLDHKVVDFAFGLPSRYKIDAGMKKKIVQDAFRSMLPEEIYNRPKHGFEIPLLDWFRKELWGLIDQDLLKDAFVEEQGIFNVEATRQLKRKLKSSNPGDSHATVWALIVFQYWWKKYFV